MIDKVLTRDTPDGERALTRWQTIHDAGGGAEGSAGYWMQVAYEVLLDQEESVYSQVQIERDKQERAAAKNYDIGWRSLADPTTLTEYRLAVVGEEHGEVCKELNELRVKSPGASVANLRHELIQLAACAVAWVEGIDSGWVP
jgi:hypothetical protein